MSHLLRTAAIAALLVPSTTAAPQSAGGAGLIIQTKSGPVAIERLAALEEPWGMAFLPDGRLLVTEKPGVQRRIRDVIQAPDGTVLLLSDGKSGELLRLTPGDPRNGTRQEGRRRAGSPSAR